MGLIDELYDYIYKDEIFDSDRSYYKSMNDFIRDNICEDEEYSVEYSVSDDLISEIKDFILNGEYNSLLKPLVKKLYDYTETENLLHLYNNIKTIQIIKDNKFKQKYFSLNDRFISGQYEPITNTISYYYKDTLAHEFLHMSSTPKRISDTCYTTGFKIMSEDIEFARGFNEGYTDLLTRRIFFDEDYNTDTCYKINLYLLRIFELLYEDYKTLERDYFISNYQSPIGNFINYGSIDEFFKLTTYLDWFAFTKVINDEDKEIFDLMKNVIKRCSYDKLTKAEEITEEYFESEKKPLQKIFKI